MRRRSDGSPSRMTPPRQRMIEEMRMRDYRKPGGALSRPEENTDQAKRVTGILRSSCAGVVAHAAQTPSAGNSTGMGTPYR